MIPNIAISGRIASGKSTVAGLLHEHWGSRVVSIAESIKLLAECARCGETEFSGNVLTLLCGDDDVKMIRASQAYAQLCLKHANELSSTPKPRAFLQDLGARLRDLDEDIWVRAVLENGKRNPEASFVCDDTRYVNEADRFAEAGWLLIRCECPAEVLLYRVKHLYPNVDPSRLTHHSETSLDNYPHWNTTIDTTQSPAEIVELLEALIGPRVR